MILLIAGASHTGKTLLAQTLMEKYHYPYFSIDHLKMGLIRSGQTALTPLEDDKLTEYLWPIVREMIKTVIENKQNLILEGCYLPFDYKKDFTPEYLAHIRYLCLVFSQRYIETNDAAIRSHANVIEARLQDDYSKADMLADNRQVLMQCKKHKCNYFLIEKAYSVEEECAAFERQEEGSAACAAAAAQWVGLQREADSSFPR